MRKAFVLYNEDLNIVGVLTDKFYHRKEDVIRDLDLSNSNRVCEMWFEPEEIPLYDTVSQVIKDYS